ncbi:MAG: lytic transglycosylase domain-containing protein [Deltaproteobacteria bacterium]|nr:lytic transglycosylase domain-containing protein [Deltaproteobacteria bacterium]
MNRKSNKFSILYTLCLSLILGFSLLSLNGKVMTKEVPEKRALVIQIENYLEQEGFFLTGKMRSEFVSHLLSTAKDYEFDPWLILAIIKVESSFNPEAISNRGAMGLLQLKPIAAKEVAQVFEDAPIAPRQLLNPFVNVKIGVQYLSFLRDEIGKNPSRMLTAYNMGPTNVKRTGANSSGYSRKVLKIYKTLLSQFTSA